MPRTRAGSRSEGAQAVRTAFPRRRLGAEGRRGRRPAAGRCRSSEIGPGAGALTLPLAASARLVIGIELDRDLAADLASVAPPNVRVVVGDILDIDLARVLPPPAEALRIRVVGNLPYNISSPILFRLLDAHADDGRISDATLMLQKEVADRLVAAPGTRDYGVLDGPARAAREDDAPAHACRPAPSVRRRRSPPRWSGSTSCRTRTSSRPRPRSTRWCAALFTRRRKTLGNALAAYAGRAGRDRGAVAGRHRHRSATPAGDADDRGVRDAGGAARERPHARVATASTA